MTPSIGTGLFLIPLDIVTYVCMNIHHNETIYELPTNDDHEEVDLEFRESYAADTEVSHTGTAQTVQIYRQESGAASIIDIRGCEIKASSSSLSMPMP